MNSFQYVFERNTVVQHDSTCPFDGKLIWPWWTSQELLTALCASLDLFQSRECVQLVIWLEKKE